MPRRATRGRRRGSGGAAPRSGGAAPREPRRRGSRGGPGRRARSLMGAVSAAGVGAGAGGACSLMGAVAPRVPEIGLQSRWFRQHRSACAPDRLEPNEPRGSPRCSVVKAQVHFVQRRADLHDQAKCTAGCGCWPRGDVLPAGEHQARSGVRRSGTGGQGPAVRDPAVRDLAVFHDHEGFTTLWSSKSFAIMKIRSGIRIAFADMGGRAGYAGSAGVTRPGTGGLAAGAGQPKFPQATAVRTASGRVVSRTGVLFPTRLSGIGAQAGGARRGWRRRRPYATGQVIYVI